MCVSDGRSRQFLKVCTPMPARFACPIVPSNPGPLRACARVHAYVACVSYAYGFDGTVGRSGVRS